MRLKFDGWVFNPRLSYAIELAFSRRDIRPLPGSPPNKINDPGNLGTIIRLCDWFDVEQLICSANTVNCYNRKVVQASMGSLSRVSIIYCDLKEYLKNETRPIYGAVLNGKNVYKSALQNNAVLVMGNEANGISDEIQKLISLPITIPQFGKIKKTESLNVAMASAILLSEFKQ